jgi:ABC-2 type transport system permease protein
MILFLFTIQRLVEKTNKTGLKSNIKTKRSPLKFQHRSVIQAIIHKEMKKLFSVTQYALNIGFGPVIMTLAAIASLFFQSQIEGFLEGFIGVGLDVEVLVIIFIGFCITMTFSSAISLSLEGKNFWILKSLPIKAETIMFAKILFNILVVLPLAILSIILFGISFKIKVFNLILLIFLSSSYALLTSTFYAIINLHLPKFNYINEIEVIKQSAAVLIAVFGGMGIMAGLGFLYTKLMNPIDLSLKLLILTGILLILSIFLLYYIKTQSYKLFSKMN